ALCGCTVLGPGVTGAPAEIDLFRARPRQRPHVVADRHDAIAANGDRARDAEVAVDGNDLAVVEHQVRAVRRGGTAGAAGGKEECEENARDVTHGRDYSRNVGWLGAVRRQRPLRETHAGACARGRPRAAVAHGLWRLEVAVQCEGVLLEVDRLR